MHSVRKESVKQRQQPGFCYDYLMRQQKNYNEFKEAKKNRGEKEPLGIGILIFDEVKVIDKLL